VAARTFFARGIRPPSEIIPSLFKVGPAGGRAPFPPKDRRARGLVEKTRTLELCGVRVTGPAPGLTRRPSRKTPMPDEPRFPDADVREILRASPNARLPSAPSRGSGGLTLSDVESIAREAGLDASGIAGAAADLVIRRSGGFGGASRIQVKRTVPGVVAERDFGRIADAIGDAAGETGQREVALGSLLWRTGRGATQLDARVSPEGERTSLHVRADGSAVKGLCFVGSIAGALALGGITGAILEPSSVVAGVGIMAGAATAGVAAGWTAWRVQARRLRERVSRVFAAASASSASVARDEEAS